MFCLEGLIGNHPPRFPVWGPAEKGGGPGLAVAEGGGCFLLLQAVYS